MNKYTQARPEAATSRAHFADGREFALRIGRFKILISLYQIVAKVFRRQ